MTETPRDFEYFLVHPNTIEIMTLIKEKAVVKPNPNKERDLKSGLLPDFRSTSDLGYCRVSVDRKGYPEYRVYFTENGIEVHEDFQDFMNLVTFIAAKWW